MKARVDAMMNCTITHYFRILPLVLTCVILASCDADHADNNSSAVDGKHSYAGETITVVIGLDASAGGVF